MTHMMSGYCNFPATERVVRGEVVAVPPSYSHEKCALVGCPCGCHLGTDEYECGECKQPLREAPLWPNDFAKGDERADPDEMVFVHIDPATGRALSEWCA